MSNKIFEVSLHAHPIVVMSISEPESDGISEVLIENKEAGFEKIESSFFLDESLAIEIIKGMEKFIEIINK